MPASTSSKIRVGVASAAREHRLDGQRHARQLAARRDAGQRPRRLAGVRREQERDRVGARRIERRGVQCRPTNAADGKPRSTRTLGHARPRGPRRPWCRARRCSSSAAAAPQPRSCRASAAVARAHGRRRAVARPRRAPRSPCSMSCSSVSPYLRSSPYSTPRRSSIAAAPSVASPIDSVAPAQLQRRCRLPRPRARQAARPASAQSDRGAPARAVAVARARACSRAAAARPPAARAPRPAARDALRVAGHRQSPRSSSTSPARGAAASISSAACSASSSRRVQLVGIDRQLAQRSLDWRATPAPRSATAARSASWPPYASSSVALPRGRQEPLLLVLAVDLDQRLDRPPRAAPAVTVSSSMRATLRPSADTSRTQISGSARRRLVEQCLHSGAGRTVAHQRRSPPARPCTRPSASISSDLPAPVSPVMTVRPGPKRDARTLDEGQVANRELSAAPSQAGSSAAFWRSSSQNGSAPRGSMKRIGRSAR